MTATMLDALVREIAAGTHDSVYDLSADGVVNKADLDQWLGDAATANGYDAPFLLGDSNLDGTVDAADLNSLALGWRQNLALWSAGDFTADGIVDSADLNALALNWHKSIPTAAAVVAPIPEPSTWLLSVIGLAFARQRPKRSSFE